MHLRDLLLPSAANDYTPHVLQKVAVIGMGTLVLLSFTAANVQALLWQTSQWLVGAVLPAVVVDLTNDERTELSEPILQRSLVLDEAARLKAEHMAKNQYFAHYSPDGVSPWYWFEQVDYTYAHAGENLAIHFNDSSAVMKAWMESPTHRANIVNEDYTEIGVGTAQGTFEGYETVYVVQLFGTPAAAIQPKAASNPVKAVPAKPAQPNVEVVEEPALLTLSATTSTTTEATTTPQVLASESKMPVLEQSEVNSDDQLTVAEETELRTPESYIATSSGLQASLAPGEPTNASFSSAPPLGLIATSPSTALQVLYVIIGAFVALVLITSIIMGLRYDRPRQVVYGIGLLLLMTGLFTLQGMVLASPVVAAQIGQEY